MTPEVFYTKAGWKVKVGRKAMLPGVYLNERKAQHAADAYVKKGERAKIKAERKKREA